MIVFISSLTLKMLSFKGFKMKKINIEDKVLVHSRNGLIQVLVTRVNRTTFQGLDIDNALEVYFIKDIKKVISRQKTLELYFESISNPCIQTTFDFIA